MCKGNFAEIIYGKITNCYKYITNLLSYTELFIKDKIFANLETK